MPETKRYVRLKNLLEEKITSGSYKPGDRFFSQTELMKKYGLSFSTVIRALDELVREGYLIRKQGKGTFVAQASLEGSSHSAQAVRNIILFAPWQSDLHSSALPVNVPSLFRNLEEVKPSWLNFRLIPISDAADDLEPYLFSKEPMHGVICLYPTQDHLEILSKMAADCQVIVISEMQIPEATVFSQIITDISAAVQLTTESFLRQGHRATGLVLPDEGSLFSNRCIQGYRSAFRDANLTYRETLISYATPDDSNGYHATLQLVNRNSDIKLTAVIAATEAILSGVVYAAQAMNLSLSDELAVATLSAPNDSALHLQSAVQRTAFSSAAVAEAVVQLLVQGQKSSVLSVVSIPPRITSV